MDYSVLEGSTLFQGLTAAELRDALEKAPHHIQCYDKGEIIFHMMEPARYAGVVLEGRVEAQKPFPNGSQINVSVRLPGEMIGPAAVFSRGQKYPCDITAIDSVTVMMFRKEDMLKLLQANIRILENFTREIATATYMLQQRLELLSYSGTAQKAAFWLLMQARQSGISRVHIPKSISKWAMLMNVSRPSLHRELKRLEEKHIISYAPPVIEILDTKALQAILSK